MPDELRPDDIPDLWREEPRTPVGMSVDAVQRKAQQVEMRTRRGFRVTGFMMIGVAGCYLWFLCFFPGTLQRIGSTLTLAAYLYCAYQWKKTPAKHGPGEVPAATVAAYKTQLQRLRDFSFVSNLMAPFLPGPAVFLLGFLLPEFGIVKAVALVSAMIVSPFIVAIPLMRRKRQMLDREIRSLDALVR